MIILILGLRSFFKIWVIIVCVNKLLLIEVKLLLYVILIEFGVLYINWIVNLLIVWFKLMNDFIVLFILFKFILGVFIVCVIVLLIKILMILFEIEIVIFFWVLIVDVFKWGVIIILLCVIRGELVVGLCLNILIVVWLICFLFNVFISVFLLIILLCVILIICKLGFVLVKKLVLIKFFVLGVSGVCNVMKLECWVILLIVVFVMFKDFVFLFVK